MVFFALLSEGKQTKLQARLVIEKSDVQLWEMIPNDLQGLYRATNQRT